MAEPPISTSNIQDPGAGSREDIKSKSFHLFNCDHTFRLESVEKLLKSIEAQVGFDISPVQRYFDLREMADVRDSIIKEHTQMNYAIFVVHANESRLSINEGIGYAMIYRALMKKTGFALVWISSSWVNTVMMVITVDTKMKEWQISA